MSVVIATRNRREELARTLRELRALRPRPPIVVVDNASDDGTAGMVCERFPGVDVLRLPVNRGAAARNAGVLRAPTPYVAFSDDDSWWAPDALTRAADALDRYPRLGLVAAAVDVGEQRRPDPINDALAHGLPPRPDLPGPPVLGFMACAAVVRREAFWSVRGFSGALFFGAEETLLAYDLAAAGWDLCHLPSVRARHLPSTSRPSSAWRTAQERRNNLLIAALRRPWPVAATEAARLLRDARHDPAARRALAPTAAALPMVRHRHRLPAEVEFAVRTLSGGPDAHPASASAPRTTRDGDGTPPPSPVHPDGGTGDGPDGRVAVVVITRDRRDAVLRTLGLLTALPERPEVIVVDNGSADGTPDAVAGRFPGVRLIAAGENLGAVARNLAVRHVATPYVAFCDDDTWWAPGALGKAADLLDAHPALASVTARILVEPGGREDPITPELRDSPVPAPPWLPGPALLSVLAGATMMRASAFRAAGGFSPRLWLGGEEELLCLDLAARGWWMCWSPSVVVHHCPAGRDSRSRRRVGIRNTLWTTWLRRRPAGAARRTITVLRGLPRDRTSLAAVAEAVRGLPWVLRERRPVPRHVEYGLRLLEGPQRRSSARRYVG